MHPLCLPGVPAWWYPAAEPVTHSACYTAGVTGLLLLLQLCCCSFCGTNLSVLLRALPYAVALCCCCGTLLSALLQAWSSRWSAYNLPHPLTITRHRTACSRLRSTTLHNAHLVSPVQRPPSKTSPVPYLHSSVPSMSSQRSLRGCLNNGATTVQRKVCCPFSCRVCKLC